MKEKTLGSFYDKIARKKDYFPKSGLLELTYRCSLDCVHCYCKGSELDEEPELNTAEWKRILDVIKDEGTMWVVFSGGDPLIREDFLEIYSYAKRKGFLINIFTNAQLFTKEVIDYLAKSPPFSIEITLNGISKNVYESITQKEGSFEEVMRTLRILKEKKFKLILKSNCLKQNKDEVVKIKKWSEELLGKPGSHRHHFKYDPMIYPRLNGNKAPCSHRLSFEEIKEVRMQDPDIWAEYQRGVKADFPDLTRDRMYLYRCNAWMRNFFINPYGRLKFCQFTDKFSVDLKNSSFKEGFYDTFPKLLGETFKTDSRCRDCELRSVCYHCPARAYLETGDEEAPVPYYCELAKATVKEMELAKAVETKRM